MTLALGRVTAVVAAIGLIAACSHPPQARAEDYMVSSPRPIVSFTFDDDFIQDTTVIKPLLDANGIKAGFAVPSGFPGLNDPRLMTWDQVKALADDGNEIIAHTIDHKHLLQMSADDQTHEVNNLAVYEAHGIHPQGFAYPFGEHDAQLRSIVAKYYDYGLGIADSASGSEEPLHAYAIRRVPIRDTTRFADLKDDVDAAIANNEYLVFIVHSGNGSFSVEGGSTEHVTQIIAYLRAHNVPIIPPGQAFDVLTRTGK